MSEKYYENKPHMRLPGGTRDNGTEVTLCGSGGGGRISASFKNAVVQDTKEGSPVFLVRYDGSELDAYEQAKVGKGDGERHEISCKQYIVYSSWKNGPDHTVINASKTGEPPTPLLGG